MTDEQENNQILTQQPQTISPDIDEFDRPAFTDADAISAPTETPAEIPPVENDLTIAPEVTESSEEIPRVENELTTVSESPESSAEIPSVENELTTTHEPTETSGEISQNEDDLITSHEQTETSAEISQIEDDLITSHEQTETSAEISQIEDDLITTREPIETSAEISPVDNDFTSAAGVTETPPAPQPSIEDSSTEIHPTVIVPISADNAPEIGQSDTDINPTHPAVKPEPKPTRIWQLLTVFMSGMLVGSVLSLGTLVAWRLYQERANLQIKLPADVPLPPSPSPVATVPARLQPGIPPAPGTGSPIPTNNPLPNPTQIPSLSGVPQSASPSPLPSPPASPFPSPSLSPSPAAETAVTERVTFEAGATGTTLANTLPDNKSKRYLVDCRGGQTMTLNVPEGAVSATIIAPNGETVGTANSTTPWEGQLPTSGDYTIEISGDSQANYGVKIEVK